MRLLRKQRKTLGGYFFGRTLYTHTLLNNDWAEHLYQNGVSEKNKHLSQLFCIIAKWFRTAFHGLTVLKSKFHYANFHQNCCGESCEHKRWNRKLSVSHKHKSSRHVKMFVTKSMTSPWQTRFCWNIVYYNARKKFATKSMNCCGHKSRKSATQIMKVSDKVCELSWFVFADFVAKSE